MYKLSCKREQTVATPRKLPSLAAYTSDSVAAALTLSSQCVIEWSTSANVLSSPSWASSAKAATALDRTSPMSTRQVLKATTTALSSLCPTEASAPAAACRTSGCFSRQPRERPLLLLKRSVRAATAQALPRPATRAKATAAAFLTSHATSRAAHVARATTTFSDSGLAPWTIASTASNRCCTVPGRLSRRSASTCELTTNTDKSQLPLSDVRMAGSISAAISSESRKSFAPNTQFWHSG
mmetsp:Transcript_106731/g.299972  ORF Transcript_106731/g.299972 Transcript_106731/m.299972 type:complete len:240 (+) Transcript_106731:83-802(+)